MLDPPGQPELTTHHMALPKILHRLEKSGYRVSCLEPSSSDAADSHLSRLWSSNFSTPSS